MSATGDGEFAMTRWWKCDLHVATPAWDFELPGGSNYDFSRPEDRQKFASLYMETAKAKGIEVLALADHNTGEWIDVMVAAGKAKGITVFPGCEITTGTGADGAHLIVIGDLHKTSQDFDRLLVSPVGFDEVDHPRFHTVAGKQVPGSAGNTIAQILDDLPDGLLAIGPHVLNENGLANMGTAKGDIRWKALHHPKLVAIDPGDCSESDAESYNGRFRRRALSDYPRLKSIAFVSASDAYSLEGIGSRFTWIRMEEPTLEGLRQAFLDREARLICDWDPKLNDYPEHNPNNIRHAWVRDICLHEILRRTTTSLQVTFHPGLNVLIGGRGSGKSTVVAALRQLYAGNDTLPEIIRGEAAQFAEYAFAGASIEATHFVAASQEQQTVTWSDQLGLDRRGQTPNGVATTFRVRVVNQKELYARVATDSRDPLSASRSLLSLVDESLGLLRPDDPLPGTWAKDWNELAAAWMAVARSYHSLVSDLAAEPTLQAEIAVLRTQIASFDSDTARTRREAFEALAAARRRLDDNQQRLESYLHALTELTSDVQVVSNADGVDAETTEIEATLLGIEISTRQAVADAVAAARSALDQWRTNLAESEWMNAQREGEKDRERYLQELKAQGLSPDAYINLRSALDERLLVEAELVKKRGEKEKVEKLYHDAWMALLKHRDKRGQARTALLDRVAGRSKRLRFKLNASVDVGGWVHALRELLGLRADGFLEDVPLLAEWLWLDDAKRSERLELWKEGLVKGDLKAIAAKNQANLRASWQERLEKLDEVIRLRLATEMADDVVEMSFLRDDGDPDVESHWQPITRGSPGQRTAAMLAFVLHHGTEPLVLDQPEDDLDTEWLSRLVIEELRASRWRRQLIVVSHNANVPVNGDADRVIVLENVDGVLQVRSSDGDHGDVREHCGAIEVDEVRSDIQKIMEGGVRAFQNRERRYNLEHPF
jgi:energy-coupling factor transporter ATP-binding protein EcfA2